MFVNQDHARAGTSGKDGKSEAQPGTSKDPDDTDGHDVDDDNATITDDGEDRKKVSLLTYLKFLFELINSFMVSGTKYVNKFSRDYRYIRKVLAKEKKLLKVSQPFIEINTKIFKLINSDLSYFIFQAKPDFRMGTRLGINQIWQPIPLLKER